MEKEIPSKYRKICANCTLPLDTREDHIRLPPNKYAHKDCPVIPKRDDSTSTKKKEVVCFYCGETFKIEGDNFRMARVNRYAHPHCYEKYHQEDDEYVDQMYATLTQYGVKYDYLMCENQRLRFISENGYTNKGMALTIKYFYEHKNGDPKRARGLGIIPYVYEEAKQYYYREMLLARQLQQVVDEPLQTTVMEVKNKPAGGKRKKRVINLDDL